MRVEILFTKKSYATLKHEEKRAGEPNPDWEPMYPAIIDDVPNDRIAAFAESVKKHVDAAAAGPIELNVYVILGALRQPVLYAQKKVTKECVDALYAVYAPKPPAEVQPAVKTEPEPARPDDEYVAPKPPTNPNPQRKKY